MNAAAAELDSSLPIPDDAPRVRLMCSLGGRILPRPQDNQLRYVGGDTRIVAVHRTSTFSTLHDKLSKLAPSPEVTIKYQLPNEDLDSLISVTGDEDVENMMEEHDRLASSAGAAARTARLRLFIFPAGDAGPGPAGFGSMLDGSGSKRDSWFLDVLNGGSGRLERGRSDVSSLVSEVPDYLFGLDNNSEDSRPKLNASEPSSPVPSANSPKYSSTSSVVAPSVSKGYVPNPVWPYAQEPVPVYYMPPPVRPFPVQYYNLAQPASVGPMYRPPPVQGVWTNPGHSVPVYSAYEYPVVGDGGGMLKGPVYPGTGAAPAGGEMAGTAAMGRASQN